MNDENNNEENGLYVHVGILTIKNKNNKLCCIGCISSVRMLSRRIAFSLDITPGKFSTG